MSIDHWDVERLAHGPTQAQENAWNAQPDTWSALNPGAPWAAHEDTVAAIEADPGYMSINATNYWDQMHAEAERTAQLHRWHDDDQATEVAEEVDVQ
jgi:hypothetical protein